MSELVKAVEQARATLVSVRSLVDAANPSVFFPERLNVKAGWISKANLHKDLEETVKLFECRDSAMLCLTNLRAKASTLDASPLSISVEFGAVQMTLYAARLLAMNSYLATTWSVYDRLSNVVGRLMAKAEMTIQDNKTETPNPARNPKLVEDLMAEDDGCYQGFEINQLLSKLHGESIWASYLLRNSFMHDGGMINNIPILSGSSAATCFLLSKENSEMLNKVVAKRAGSMRSEIFKERDFVDQMKVLHEELDKMFAGLVEFVVGSFYSQVSLFGERIGVNPAATAPL